jgi:hypothetical protein
VTSCLDVAIYALTSGVYKFFPTRQAQDTKGTNLLDTLKRNLQAYTQAAQVNKVNYTARTMLDRYCGKDAPNNPSIVCDAIVVGAVILSLAITDRQYGCYEEKRHYPNDLDTLYRLCNPILY